MDRPLATGYACLYLHAKGMGEVKSPIKWAHHVAHSPAEGLRWVYDVTRDLPQTSRGGFLESRGLFDFSESFRDVVRTMELDGWWSGAWLVSDGQCQLAITAVPMLPIVPTDKAARRPA